MLQMLGKGPGEGGLQCKTFRNQTSEADPACTCEGSSSRGLGAGAHIPFVPLRPSPVSPVQDQPSQWASLHQPRQLLGQAFSSCGDGCDIRAQQTDLAAATSAARRPLITSSLFGARMEEPPCFQEKTSLLPRAPPPGLGCGQISCKPAIPHGSAPGSPGSGLLQR